MEPLPASWQEPVVARALPSDLDAILEVEQACFETLWSPDQLHRDLVDNPAAYYAVVRLGGEVAGHAGMYLIEEEAHVITLGVLPVHRRHGLGLRLMLHLIGVARGRGATRMTLEVRVSNHGARALYERLGFYGVALRRGYYQDTGEDALLMWIPDLSAPWLRQRWDREGRRLAAARG